MAERSAIEWTDATFNPWWGCVRVSPACAHCYADGLARRYGHAGLWGDGGHRRFLTDGHWRTPLTWNRKAASAGARLKVFCASMADVFEDHSELDPWRVRLWNLIEETRWLHWQLLTKRPENVMRFAPWKDSWPDNVWIGTSIENGRYTFRASLLREIPAASRFISAEPLLGSLFVNGGPNRQPLDLTGIDWVIAGGESGPKSRSTEIEWLREVRDETHRAGAAFFLNSWVDSLTSAGKMRLCLTEDSGTSCRRSPRRLRRLPSGPLNRVVDMTLWKVEIASGSGVAVPGVPDENLVLVGAVVEDAIERGVLVTGSGSGSSDGRVGGVWVIEAETALMAAAVAHDLLEESLRHLVEDEYLSAHNAKVEVLRVERAESDDWL